MYRETESTRVCRLFLSFAHPLVQLVFQSVDHGNKGHVTKEELKEGLHKAKVWTFCQLFFFFVVDFVFVYMCTVVYMRTYMLGMILYTRNMYLVNICARDCVNICPRFVRESICSFVLLPIAWCTVRCVTKEGSVHM